jgi:hypothetical protein
MALVRGGRAGERAGGQSLSLSLTNACNPLLQAHPPWAQDNTKAAVSPCCLSPLVFHLASTHLGWDTQRQFTRQSRDPPGSKRRQQCSALTSVVDQPYTSHELPPLVSSCHIIPHNLLSDEHV